MCGITGYISEKKWNSAKMLEVLHHRGPDSQGEYTAEINNSNVFLGHKRLSIIDLSEGGHQPMLSEDEDIVLTFNGEIYNFLEIPSEQALSGTIALNTIALEKGASVLRVHDVKPASEIIDLIWKMIKVIMYWNFRSFIIFSKSIRKTSIWMS